MTYQISNNGLLLDEQLEEFESSPYLDSGGVPTIGYGTTVYPDGISVTMQDDSITQKQAIIYMTHDLIDVQEWLNNVIYQYNLTPNQNQFDAMCCFFYNIGYGSFQQNNPHTWEALISNDLSQFAQDMLLFNHVNGKICQGLTNRRQKEVALFNS